MQAICGETVPCILLFYVLSFVIQPANKERGGI
jgi:hypothetical protein